MSSTWQTGAEVGPEPVDDDRAHVRFGRARQDPAVDLDDRVARDDVVLDACVDDVRAERVAEQGAQGTGVHRVAGRVERRFRASGSSPASASSIVPASSGRAAAASSRKRAMTGVIRVGPGTARRSMTAAARTAALSSRGIEP